MKKFSFIVLTSLFFVACIQTVPITGRKQISLIPESEMIGMSLTNYSDFLKEHTPLPASDQRTQLVKSVGAKIQQAVTKFMAEKHLSSRLAGYAWEFNVVDDKAVNAWCMPGGKVVVYTGLLPVTQDEQSLAIVMGHEIAHAVARHGNERMTEGLVVQTGGAVLSAAVQNKPALTKNLFLQSYGIGTQLGMLKYSRNQETEADKMGLVFAAMAGYDPNAAVAFWQRMSASNGGQQPPEILSTHPSDETRIRDLKAYMPEAMKYYRP